MTHITSVAVNIAQVRVALVRPRVARIVKIRVSAAPAFMPVLSGHVGGAPSETVLGAHLDACTSAGRGEEFNTQHVVADRTHTTQLAAVCCIFCRHLMTKKGLVDSVQICRAANPIGRLRRRTVTVHQNSAQDVVRVMAAQFMQMKPRGTDTEQAPLARESPCSLRPARRRTLL